MTIDTFSVLRACRRSRIKVRTFHALYENQLMLVTELADVVNTSPTRVLGALHGDGHEFKFDSALVRLGVARSRRTARGHVIEITEHGRNAWRRIRMRLPRGALRVGRA